MCLLPKECCCLWHQTVILFSHLPICKHVGWERINLVSSGWVDFNNSMQVYLPKDLIELYAFFYVRKPLIFSSESCDHWLVQKNVMNLLGFEPLNACLLDYPSVQLQHFSMLLWLFSSCFDWRSNSSNSLHVNLSKTNSFERGKKMRALHCVRYKCCSWVSAIYCGSRGRHVFFSPP